MNPIQNIFEGNFSDTPPLWLMRQAGRYLPEYREIRGKIPQFMDLCFHEDWATEVTLQPLRRFNLDAAILFSDILVIPHVLGQSVQIVEKKGPVLEPMTSSFLEKAKDIDIKESLHVPLKIIRNVRKTLPSSQSVIGFAGSPWTIATYMFENGKSVDFAKVTSLLEENNPLFVKTMKLLEEAIGSFLLAQIEAGADIVQIFDSWARQVPVPFRKEWIVLPIRRLIKRIRDHYPKTPIIYYGRGVSDLYEDVVEGFSRVALGVDEAVSLSVMKNQLQKLAPVQGNLNPKVLVEGGKVLQESTQSLLKNFQGTPYIFNLGHGIVPQTPVDHVAQLVDWVKESSPSK